PPVVEEDEPAASADIAMSDPAPSSPAAKVAERRTQPKVEEEVDEFDNDDDDDDEMMEVAHAAAVTVASVNMSASKQVKNVAKPDPVPKSSSPVRDRESAVDASSWNGINEKLNVVGSSQPEARSLGKVDYKD